MLDSVYILIRTANRPMFFQHMMESIKKQTYKNIVTIVHSDNPNDLYVEGDIIIRSERNESLGGFCSARCASDTDFMRRAEMAGYQICKIDHALYKRRRHEKSLTKSGMTAFGGKYRKEVWKKMTEERERGIVKIVPQRIELYFTN